MTESEPASLDICIKRRDRCDRGQMAAHEARGVGESPALCNSWRGDLRQTESKGPKRIGGGEGKTI